MTIYSLDVLLSYLEPVCCSMSSFPCCFLTCIKISQEAGQVVCYFHLFQNFPQVIVIHTLKGVGIVNEAEIDAFLKLSCFAMIQRMLTIWILVPLPFLKPAWTSGSSHIAEAWLEEFWALLYQSVRWVQLCCILSILCIAFHWDWNENWSFPVLWPLLSFPNLLAYWVQHIHSIIFQDLK